MAKLELNLKYKNDDFGKKGKDGKYSIRADLKTYELLVDGVPVIDLSIEFERYTDTRPYYKEAHISYNNMFYLKDDKYTGKGYATIALENVTNDLINEGIVPKITLDINDDNDASLRVAEKAGYTYIKNNEYAMYHPEALKMIEQGLEYLKDTDEELYEMQMSSELMTFRRYIEELLKKEEKQKSK